MFRGINFNNDLDITIELWKNKNEIIGIIDNTYVTEINYTFGEPTQLQLEIPKFIMKNNEKVLNRLYNKIKIRQQIIVTINNEKERFIITDQSLKLEKRKGVKSLTAYSFEKTLENKRISFLDTKTRTLVKDDLYVHDGFLNEVVKVSGWKLGYVDEDAKMITEMCNENVHINLFENYANNKIENNGLIWEKDIITNVDNQYAVNIQIDYLGLKTYDENGTLLKTENVSTELKPLYTNVKHIKVYHHSETGNRYGCKVILTLTDNVEVEQVHTFTNVVNKKIIAENINVIYETGKIIEGTRAKFISVEATNENVLNFMKMLQEQFECVFKYDTINKIINCYSKKNIGEDKPIELSYDTNVISVNITPNSEVPNCLAVEGNDGLSISDVNPYGGDYLYNYKWYIDNDFLPEEVVIALEKYNELLETKQKEYETLKNSISDLISNKTKYDSEISSLEYRIKYYYNLLTGFISAGESNPRQEQIKNEITQLENRLNECISKRMLLQDQILSVEDNMIQISKEIQKENSVDVNGNKIFTEDDLEILDDISYVSIYEDSYYTTSYGLYNNALKVFDEMIKPSVEFTIECGNLVKLIKNKLFNVIELGSFFMVNTDDIPELGQDKVRFIGYKLIPKEKKISSTIFTNKEFKVDNLNIASNVGKKATKSTNTIRTFKDVWEEAILSNDYVSKLVDGGLNLATTQINSRSSRNLLDFSEYGSFWKDADNPTDGNQVYIGNSIIAVSTNGFSTSSVAMTGDGLIAETVIGKLLLGSRCEISTPDGLFVIGNNEDNSRIGLHISDDVTRDRIFLGLERDSVTGYQMAKLELKDKTGREVCISENGIIQTGQFVVWDNISKDFPMKIPYKSDEGVFSNKKIVMSLYFDKYRAFERGMSSGGTKQTSSSGGGFSIETTSGGGGYYNKTITPSTEAEVWWTPSTDMTVPIGKNLSNADQSKWYWWLDLSYLRHYHDVSTTIEIPSHSHSVSISKEAHSHEINTTHNHGLEYAIHEQDSMCSNVKIFINDKLVRQNINGNADVDITEHIAIGQTNNIRIESETNGRLTVNFHSKCFVGW